VTPQQILALIIAAVVIIVLPAATVYAIVHHLRTKPGDRPGSGSVAGLGPALQELDRLVARPSAEHTVEAERPIVKRDDDRGGD
jgi:hypothetical protein